MSSDSRKEQYSVRRERDQIIYDLYTKGATQEEIARRFRLSKPRVGQILRRAGYDREYRQKSMFTHRASFIGVRVRSSIKSAAYREAEREGVSISSFVAKILEEELSRRNVQIEEPPSTEFEPELPLEP